MLCVLIRIASSGDSNEYTQRTIFNILKKITLNYPKSAAMGFFPGTQERFRNSHGKRAISVRAIEVLLYLFCSLPPVVIFPHRLFPPLLKFILFYFYLFFFVLSGNACWQTEKTLIRLPLIQACSVCVGIAIQILSQQAHDVSMTSFKRHMPPRLREVLGFKVYLRLYAIILFKLLRRNIERIQSI